MTTGNELRQRFLDYFGRNGHTVVRSSPLVPAQDPTLLFTNAGMVQFKSVFLGEEKRPYARAASAQKCVRAGGKHNDLENVGRTARHHTFFEMLGNFSFGDYFKREAVGYAWEFLTKDLGLPKDRLKATVYTDDDEAFGLWQGVAGLAEDRILRLGEADNFWAMGDTGPCGPCSEIHFHQGEHLPCAEEAAGRRCLGPACECDRWLEVWNLVFMQFNRDAGGRMTPLPRPSIDTGMGLERIAAVLQGKDSNFQTDLIRPLIAHVERLARKRYGEPGPAGAEQDVSMRVIADHARAAGFLITDGVTPSNEWRGYVLRRIMRRAMRHGRMLGLHEPFLWQVTATVVETLGAAYPEIREQHPRVAETVRLEEERFAETLDLGTAKIREYLATRRDQARKVVDGKFLFTLYDTHGFPTDLAQEMFQDAGWSVPPESLEAFEREMEAQRQRARGVRAFAADEAAPSDAVFAELSAELPTPVFLGYTQLATPARILAMVAGGRRRPEAASGETVEVVLDRTPAYAESGGQVGDTGMLVGRDGQGEILDTYYRGAQLIVHRVRVTRGALRESEEVAVSVEPRRRQGLRLHHTGTHLLHAALRRILGTHVTQAGSLVAPDHLRFDFSHGGALREREVEAVESLVNEQVQANIALRPEEMDLQAALRSGAMALFGEKYGDRVRVVRIGDFSTELCGGTHLDATGQIGLFKVTSEGAVASGVRRIEAVTGEAALRHVGQEEQALREAAGLLRIPPLELPRRLQKLLDEQRQLEKQLQQLEGRLARSRALELVAAAKEVAGVPVLAARLDGLDPEGLRSVVDLLRARLGSGVICLGAVTEGKVNLVASVSKDLTGRFQAGTLIQEVSKQVGGGGGGRPDLAQAGGKDPSRLDAALAQVPGWVERVAGR
ncbi:MAG: alanine--tRNA ligase [Candidatus Rokubacteria bacterium RIFCSPLOWO2_12_FULL_71_19]|nr:MAG: alanine--tRNA ligase [Candidatus Rokubacteria bacterium RIFCSPLOWO2_12_FULL_71_19]